MDIFGAITSIAGSFLGGVGQSLGSSIGGGSSGSSAAPASSGGGSDNFLGNLTSPMTQAKSVSGKTPSKAAPVVNGLDALKNWAALIQNGGI